MTTVQDAHVALLIEEAEQFASLVKTMTTVRGFSARQRATFGIISTNLAKDLERFTSDALLAIGDGQEIGRRIEAR